MLERYIDVHKHPSPFLRPTVFPETGRRRPAEPDPAQDAAGAEDDQLALDAATHMPASPPAPRQTAARLQPMQASNRANVSGSAVLSPASRKVVDEARVRPVRSTCCNHDR